MISLIDMEKVSKSLKPVTTAEYVVGKGASFHPEGLFSEVIFGSKESIDRKKKYSYIDLNCQVLHPVLVSVMRRYNKKVLLAIKREKSYSFNKDNILVEDKNGEINGITSVIANFEKIIEAAAGEDSSPIRLDMKQMILHNHKKGKVFISQCLVIPAGYRDAIQDKSRGGYVVDTINEFYVRIIRSSNQVQSFSTGPMREIFSAKMQSLLEDLYNFVISKVSKKEGLVRQNILGKRADFTGRAVITGGSSEIRVDEIGIPFKIIVKLFEPFFLHAVMYSGKVDKEKFGQALDEFNKTALSIPNLRSLVTGISKGDHLTPALEELVKATYTGIISDKVVLAKRDPAIHSESVQGFKPVMIDGDTIQLSISKCKGFNADFDGDQMAIYVPMTKEAIEEARDKMISSESKDSIDQLTDSFEKDIVVGIYSLTRNPNPRKKAIKVKDEAEFEKMDIADPIIYDGEETTVGRVLFNKLLPAKFRTNEPVDSKKLKSLTFKIYNFYGKENRVKYVDYCQEVARLGGKYYTLQGQTFSLDDLELPSSIMAMKDKLKTIKDPEEANRLIEKMEKELHDYVIKNNINLDNFISGGGLKGMTQIRQILIAKGLIQNIDGSIDLVQHSFADGFTSQEYFKSGRGARAGIIDRVINTSDTGYLSRKLVYALQRVEADPGVKDCHTKKYLTLKVTPDIAKRIKGRYVINALGLPVLFDESKYLNEVVRLRSPMYCLSSRICATCYGQLLQRNRTHYVGILAGEILGEFFTQNIMRTFHVGGAVSVKFMNIMKELTRTLEEDDKKYVESNFSQADSEFKSKIPGKIVIDKTVYEDHADDLEISPDSIIMNYGYFKILTDDNREVDITLDTKVEIDLKNKGVEHEENLIKIQYGKGDTIFKIIPVADIFSEKVKIAEALFSGRSPWKNADHYFRKVNDIYDKLSCDMVHVEILVSNLLRDKGNPSFPARRNKNYNPTIISLKKIPASESWLQSFMFENPNDSLLMGLLYDRPEEETILERIVTGNL